MDMADFMNFLFCNSVSNYYYIASIIILIISTGRIQSRVIVDFISSLLASTLYQLIEWPLKLSLFFYAVISTIRCHGFKYKFLVLFLVVDLLLNTFLAAQIPIHGSVACFDGPEECCGFIHYDTRKSPAELWLEFLSRILLTFYICCSIYVIVSKKNEIMEFVRLWYRFIVAKFFCVLAVLTIFVFLIRFKYQEIGVFILVVYMASRLLFQAWFPIPAANITILRMESSLDFVFHDAVESESDENSNEGSGDAGDNSDEPDENSDEDNNEGTDEGSDDDLDENGEKVNNDDDDEDCDEDDDEDQDDENDEDSDRVDEDLDDDGCSLM